LGGTKVRAADWQVRDVVEFKRIKPAQTLKPSRSLKVSFSLPAFGNSSEVVPVINDLIESIGNACSSTGGALEKDSSQMSTSDNAVRKAFALLADTRPFGNYTCQKGNETQFFIELFAPSASQPSPFLTSGYTWNIYIHAVYRDVFKRLEDRQTATNEEAERFRVTLTPSSMVAIAARDLPEAARPQIPREYSGFGFFKANDYRVCAMVIQAQGPLFQVQVGTQSLYVKRDAIWPFRKSINFGSQMESDWENWCIGS
jgi:hypothetical protein